MRILDKARECQHPKDYYFVCPETEQTYGMIVACHSRFRCQCPDCSKRWKRKVMKKFYWGIAAMKKPKFLTLTLTKRRSDGIKLDEIWEMRKALFKKLRKRGYRIDSWLGVVEMPNHVHIVLDGDYIPQDLISKTWHTITGDSYIVDIRRVRKEGRVISYLSKYLGKSLGTSEDMERLRGFHVVQSYNLPPLDVQLCTCPICGQVHAFVMISEEQFYHDPDRQAPD